MSEPPRDHAQSDRVWARPNCVHEDRREFLEWAEQIGKVKRIDGASWDFEMAGISEMFGAERSTNPAALLFDSIPGYPKGYRAVWGAGNSPRRFVLTFGFPNSDRPMDMVQAYRDRMREGFELIPRKWAGPMSAATACRSSTATPSAFGPLPASMDG